MCVDATWNSSGNSDGKNHTCTVLIKSLLNFLICSLTPLNLEYLDAVGTPLSVSDLFFSSFLINVLRHLSVQL